MSHLARAPQGRLYPVGLTSFLQEPWKSAFLCAYTSDAFQKTTCTWAFSYSHPPIFCPHSWSLRYIWYHKPMDYGHRQADTKLSPGGRKCILFLWVTDEAWEKVRDLWTKSFTCFKLSYLWACVALIRRWSKFSYWVPQMMLPWSFYLCLFSGVFGQIILSAYLWIEQAVYFMLWMQKKQQRGKWLVHGYIDFL